MKEGVRSQRICLSEVPRNIQPIEESLVPLYEYRCKDCGHQFEKIQSFSAPEEKECPVCHGPVEKLISASAIQFKGSGWYVNDYASKSSKSMKASADSGKSDGGSGESKSGENKSGENKGGESKSADKPAGSSSESSSSTAKPASSSSKSE